MRFLLIACCVLTLSCRNQNTPTNQPNKDSLDLSINSPKDFTEFKVLNSQNISKDSIWKPFEADLINFTESDYLALKPIIIDKDIPTIQKSIAKGILNYEQLTKFYLYRIRAFDRENDKSLNAVISINPNCIEQAKQRDKALLNKKLKHPIFGMPVLLKDNINCSIMPTTAGAIALQNNFAKDAFITEQLKANGAIILGKSNLSEWAYFFCGKCPSGYSAIGGQTLNPYGRRVLDTGGSSSGSGVAVAANFCTVAVGSETSGSILSPSSKNSLVGLKPTIGLLSRNGIVPISSTLDTPGPMTKNVTDNAILLDAMMGFDETDSKSIKVERNQGYYRGLKQASITGKRFGALKKLMADSLYSQAIKVLKQKGAEVIEVVEQDIKLSDFRRLLSLDMKKDLPNYLNKYASNQVIVKSVKDVIQFNKKDSTNTMPYGQKLFEGILADSATTNTLESIKAELKTNGRQFFDIPFKTHRLDAILSINNYHAAFAAVAEYPAITIPMGYESNGSPKGITIITKPLQEQNLLNWAYVYEQASKNRKSPTEYQ